LYFKIHSQTWRVVFEHTQPYAMKTSEATNSLFLQTLGEKVLICNSVLDEEVLLEHSTSTISPTFEMQDSIGVSINKVLHLIVYHCLSHIGALLQPFSLLRFLQIVLFFDSVLTVMTINCNIARKIGTI